jgi:putative transposase
MARPLRIEYPGACYHVISRGNQRATVFHEREHYELFIHKLGEFAQQYEVAVYCYCCMPNHFHLYLQTAHANLSRFVQAFLTSFTVIMNRRHRTSGHLFQGRFKAHLVEDELYRSKLSRYIHLNPIRIRDLTDVSLKRKRELLKEFQWSSFATYIGLKKKAAWMNIDPVLKNWGQLRREQMKNYRRYVEEGLLQDVENPFDDIREQSILGSDSFMDWVKREFLLNRDIDTREQPSLNHLQRSFAFSDITDVIAANFGVDPEQILKRKSTFRTARRVLMFFACKYCSHERSLTDIAKAFSVSVSGLTRARDRIKDELVHNKELRAIIQKIKTAIEIGKKSQ